MPESCHKKAKCKSTKVVYEKKGFSYEAYACKCKRGYLGNGFLCIKEPIDRTATCCTDNDALQIEKDFFKCDLFNCPATTPSTTTTTTSATTTTTTTTATNNGFHKSYAQFG